MELYRDHSRRPSLEEEEAVELSDPSADALGVLIQEQAASNVRRVIDELPERDQARRKRKPQVRPKEGRT